MIHSGRLLSVCLSLLVLATGPAVAGAATWTALLKKHGFRRDQVGFVAIDAGGNVRASINAEKPLKPASNQKLVVVAAGLEVLGIDYQFETLVWSPLAPAGEALSGDLVVSGQGDPNISGRFFNGNATAILENWAAKLHHSGIRRIDGDLLVDDSYFDDERWIPSWNRNQVSRWYSAQIGALSLNDNCVDFTVSPRVMGGRAGFSIIPETGYIQIENTCRTVAGKRPKIGLDRVWGTNRIILKGQIGKKISGDWTGEVTVEDPGLYFGTVFKEVLERQGISLRGEVLRDPLRIEAATDRVLLHRHRSPLSVDIPIILRNSQNLHAELLLKTLGASSGEVGSVSSGGRVVREYLKKRRIPAGQVDVADGSGLSKENRLTAMVLARILDDWRTRPYFSLIVESLPVAGLSGTLKKRFRSTPLRGRLVAKTGYISGVSALSGYLFERPLESDPPAAKGLAAGTSPAAYVTGAPLPEWTFSILINGFPRKGGLSAAYGLQEDLAKKLLSLSR